MWAWVISGYYLSEVWLILMRIVSGNGVNLVVGVG